MADTIPLRYAQSLLRIAPMSREELAAELATLNLPMVLLESKAVPEARILVEDYGGAVPNSRAALQGLPGVGRKTANVVLNMWWGMPAQAVDTHIFRIANRTGIASGKDVLAVERAIEDNVPADFARHAHHWLILHGRYICTARKPRCSDCVIEDLCPKEGVS